MKYLRPLKKGLKIKVSAKQEIVVPMYNVVRVERRAITVPNQKKVPTDGYVTIMAMTGAEMIYQREARMLVKDKYIVEMLSNKRNFKQMDDPQFINLS